MDVNHMSFFEDIASALDAEGIESRVNDDVMFVPITSDLEIQFVEIDPLLPAANVYIACLLYTSPSPRDRQKSRMPSSA